MKFKDEINIDFVSVDKNLKRITNLIYKLLPEREESSDWQSLLDTIVIELSGLNKLLIKQNDTLFALICKLKGLSTLENENPENFHIFRRTIFECLSLCNRIREDFAQCQD